MNYIMYGILIFFVVSMVYVFSLPWQYLQHHGQLDHGVTILKKSE